jgi:hypothetical protein
MPGEEARMRRKRAFMATHGSDNPATAVFPFLKKSRRMVAWVICLFVMALVGSGWAAWARDNTDAVEVTVVGLKGTWKHVSTSQTPDGPRERLTTAQISWTFNADGTGTYSQKVMGRDMGRRMIWELDGQKILLKGKKGGKTKTTYTVLVAGESEMIWRNEKLGDCYHVKKQ